MCQFLFRSLLALCQNKGIIVIGSELKIISSSEFPLDWPKYGCPEYIMEQVHYANVAFLNILLGANLTPSNWNFNVQNLINLIFMYSLPFYV